MKKGDVVTVKDGSYSQGVINGKLIHEAGAGPRGEKFTVIETDCKFPVTDEYQTTYRSAFNNTVIQAIGSGKVVFIEERFLKLVPSKHMAIIDAERKNCCIVGTWVEISDKLYQEIKREIQ
ncbi:hypothetical protein KAR91_78600 [Candidatus Pacearchaeota archaeon]|nr:hypothetical protein [Candidatus Pacearchaeota archaeon]